MIYFTVRFGVADSLVDDGFEPTPELIKDMIEKAIPHADTYQTTAERVIDDTDFDLTIYEVPASEYSTHYSSRH